jgi:hypothetical protein
MSLAKTLLTRGPAVVTYNGATFYSSADLLARFGPVWNPVNTSMYGQVDSFVKDRVYKFTMRLWGAWENLSTIFPSYALAAQVGTSIFGTGNTALVILARNGDKITYKNAQITKLANLNLGVDQDLFAADVEFTCIIGNSSGTTMNNPEDANAYYTYATAQSYSDSAFAKTNYKRFRATGSWGAGPITGFSNIIPQKGFQISWDLDVQPLTCDGFGTVDMTIGDKGLIGTCKCIPIAPTAAQLEAQCSAQGIQLGALVSQNVVGDLTLTANGGSPVIVLKSAGIVEHGYVFGNQPLRQGEVTWQTTRGFTANVPDAIATVA